MVPAREYNARPAVSFLHRPLRSRAEFISWAPCGAFEVAHAGSKKKGSRQGMTTSDKFDPRPHFLMCRPRHFAVYLQHQSLDESRGRLARKRRRRCTPPPQRQWDGLFDALCSPVAPAFDLGRAVGAWLARSRLHRQFRCGAGWQGTARAFSLPAAAGRGTGLCRGVSGPAARAV